MVSLCFHYLMQDNKARLYQAENHSLALSDQTQDYIVSSDFRGLKARENMKRKCARQRKKM